MFDTLERGLYWLTSFGLGGDAEALCQLRAPIDDSTLVTEANGLVTFYRVVGSRRLIGPAEFDAQARGLATALTGLLKSGHGGRQHSVLFGFRSDPAAGAQVLAEILAPSQATAARLGADAELLFRDRLAAMRPACIEEIALFGVMTHTRGLAPGELKRWGEQRQASYEPLAKAAARPDNTITQTPFGPPAVMLSRHQAALATLEGKLTDEGGAVKVMMDRLTCGEALSLLRRFLDAGSHDPRWRPQLLGERAASTTVQRSTRTADHALPPRIGRQLVTEKLREHFGDAELVRRGRWWYGSVTLDVCPGEQPAPAFSELAASIGVHIPWQVHFDVSPNGLDHHKMEQLFAAFVGSAGEHNRAIKKAFDALKALKAAGEMVCSLRAIFTTWAETEAQCVDGISFLKSKVEGWGQAVASNESGAPAHLLLASAPGYARALPATHLPGPVTSLARLLPLFRPSSIWPNGQLVLFTTEGRPYPVNLGSPLQNFWGTLVFAPTGSGKSFLMNMLNAGVLFTPGASELPMVTIIDKGPSAKGVVRLAQSLLPPHLAEQIVYWRPTPGDVSYCVNPFDTQLGCDRPLDADRDFLGALLAGIAPNLGDEGGKFIGKVIDTAYDVFSRQSPMAKRWQWNTAPQLSARLAEVGIAFREDKPPRVWEVVDAFFASGRIEQAADAQVHAVPLLSDLSRVLQDRRIQDVYGTAPAPSGERMLDVFNRSLIAAAGEYRLFSGVTRHKSTARFVVVDIEGLAASSTSEEGRRRFGLMMLFARRLGARNFFLHPDDVAQACPPAYLGHHMERIQRIKEQLKFLEYDEIHNARGIGAVQELLQKDAREGRKYNVVTLLASQDLGDFPPDLVKNTYNFFILGAGNAAAGRELRDTFDLSDSELQTILSECTSPGKLFGMFRTNRGLLSQLLHTKPGPVETWAYNTSASDMALRDALYADVGVRRTLAFLARRFPGGSARGYIEELRNAVDERVATPEGITEVVLRQLRPLLAEFEAAGD